MDATRASLLVRIREASDGEAWGSFSRIYGPIIYQFGKRLGMQEADAADLVQDVLNEVNRSIGRFEYDPLIGRFRSWLFKIAHRAAIRMRKKEHRVHAAGLEPTARQLADEVVDPFDQELIWETEYQRELLAWAAERVRNQVSPRTWAAFWRTAAEGEKPQQVAAELGLSPGAVYVAKNRVTKRLAEKIREVDDTA